MRSTACKFVCVLSALVLLLALSAPALASSDQVLADIPLGLSVDDALWQECPVGDYIADAVRQQTGAQAALIPSGLLRNALVGDGSVTQEDVSELFWEDCEVYLYTLTGPELKALLEDSVSHWTLSVRETLDGEQSAYDGFLQLSGITVSADASAAVGDRVLSVTVDGAPLELSDSGTTVTVAMPMSSVGGGEGADTGRTLTELVSSYISAQGTVERAETGRLSVIGAHAGDIISVIPGWFFGFLLVFLVGANLISGSRKAYLEGI